MVTDPEAAWAYAPLPSDGDAAEKGRSVKIGVLVLTGLVGLALIMAVLDDSYRVAEPEKGMPVPGREWRVKGSRGKEEGVSEKTNNRGGERLRGENGGIFEWNDLQLGWQRSAFHFQPHHNWMNDPNGPVYYKGCYHLFYQYNPTGPAWGNIVWGHAVSKDMINWTHLPLAMVADHWYDSNGVWTGSATMLPGNQLVMLYTGSTNDSVQVQNLAYPADPSDPFLTNWVKYPGNPVLVPPSGIHHKDFRDPTTAWFTAGGKWRFIIGSKIKRTGITIVYETSDFKTYDMLDTILHAVPGTGMWECVDFYPVSLTGSNGMDMSTNGPHVKHVLKASMDDDRQDYYAIGRYDDVNVTWVPDDPTRDVGFGLRYDYGGKFYASKTFYDEEKKRRILWGWMPESDSELADVRKGWASLQALPRTVLYDQKTESNLIQWPIEEVESLRTDAKSFDNLKVSAGSVLPLDVHSASELDIVAEFNIDPVELDKLPPIDDDYSCSKSGGAASRGTLGPFGLLVLADGDLSELTPVYFYIAKASKGDLRTFFCTDLTRSSLATDVTKSVYGSTVPVLKGEKLSMRILVDHSIVEAFGQGGRTAITTRVYPTKAIYKDTKLYVFNNATEASITASIKTWQMSSAS